ncbi:MAG: hypothetical protein NZM04_10180 [Methylacidiphilales bacterium]|nr:hypothetical protein [Candidatus Methylacidiphilales bacterium]MDW8349749.1 hypothetical protein [Verrucomicrobiae bacterium]
MAKAKATVQQVRCPYCGHQQYEPVGGVSTMCRSCGKYFSLEELGNKKRIQPVVRQDREVVCEKCEHQQRVAQGALSTFCERCGAYINLRNYEIAGISREKIETHGDAIFEAGCNYRGTHVIAYRVTVQGYVHSRITARKELMIGEGGKVRGSLATPILHVCRGGLARSARIDVNTLEIEGEVEVDDCRAQTVCVGKHGQLKALRLWADTVRVVSGGTLVCEFKTLNLCADQKIKVEREPADDLLSILEE